MSVSGYDRTLRFGFGTFGFVSDLGFRVSISPGRGYAFGIKKLKWCAAWIRWNCRHSSSVIGPKKGFG